MEILLPTEQIDKKIEEIEALIYDLSELKNNLSDELTEAKAFYFFRGHTIESLILKIAVLEKAYKNLDEYSKALKINKKNI